MFNFLSSRLTKPLKKMQAKTALTEENISNILREIRLALLEADVNFQVVKEFTTRVKNEVLSKKFTDGLDPTHYFLDIIHKEIIHILGNEKKDLNLNKSPSIIMMVGLQGSGKTSTVAKLAKKLQKKEQKKVLIVACDVYRYAGINQLETLAKQINCDFYQEGKKDPVIIAKNSLHYASQNNYDVVIIDTAGRLHIDEKLMNELVIIKKNTRPSEILLVVDAMSGQDIFNVAKVFNTKLKLTGVIISKMDSDAKGGAAFSINHLLNLSIIYITTGEKLDEIESFYPKRMADRILGMGDVETLIEKARDVINEDQARTSLQRFINGKFNINDLLSQLKQVSKLGKWGAIASMIPGVPKLSDEQKELAEKKVFIIKTLAYSMTKKERKSPQLLKENSRKMRILKGSGRSAQEYNTLIKELDKLKKIAQKFQNFAKTGGGNFNIRNLLS